MINLPKNCVIFTYPKMGDSGKFLPVELRGAAGLTGCTLQCKAYESAFAHFARAFVRDKYRFNGWGSLRLQAELRRHRIPSHLIDAAIEELEEEEMQSEDQLTALLERKYRSLPAGLEPRKVYDRLTRFALYRGYPYEDVREAISELLSDLPDELGDD